MARRPVASHEPVPVSAFLDDMRALAAAPNPDKRLLLACDEWTLLREERDRLYRKQAKGYMVRVRAMMGEMDALGKEITDTLARTTAGRRAKADVAMHNLGNAGTVAQMVRSALNDFMNYSGDGGGFCDGTEWV